MESLKLLLVVGVVEAEHGLAMGVRCKPLCAVIEVGRCELEFVGNGPAGCFCCLPKFFLAYEIVDLDDGAIRAIGEGCAFVTEGLNGLPCFLEPCGLGDFFLCRQAPVFQGFVNGLLC